MVCYCVLVWCGVDEWGWVGEFESLRGEGVIDWEGSGWYWDFGELRGCVGEGYGIWGIGCLIESGWRDDCCFAAVREGRGVSV